MDESDLDQPENNSITKTHREILELIEEIKEFEKKFGEFEIEEYEVEKELKELDYVTFEEIEPELILFKEIEEKKPEFEKKIKKFKIDFWKKRKKDLIEKIEKPINPTTFRLRINKDGKLENIDIKKPKPRKKIKISFRRKEKKESETTQEKSKFMKLKNGLSKIKRIIPIGKKEEEEPEGLDTTETSV